MISNARALRLTDALAIDMFSSSTSYMTPNFVTETRDHQTTYSLENLIIIMPLVQD